MVSLKEDVLVLGVLIPFKIRVYSVVVEMVNPLSKISILSLAPIEHVTGEGRLGNWQVAPRE
jgi:hypothetical protein